TDAALGKTGAGPEGLPHSIIVTAEGVEGDAPIPVGEAGGSPPSEGALKAPEPGEEATIEEAEASESPAPKKKKVAPAAKAEGPGKRVRKNVAKKSPRKEK